MNRQAFEALRDLPGKIIAEEVVFMEKRAMAPVRFAEVEIAVPGGDSLRMQMTYNPRTGAKTINVTAAGLGAICRLDVDGPPHRPAVPCHKHSLQNEQCPERNLPDGVMDMPALAGSDFEAVFRVFCRDAAITHQGIFHPPEGGAP